MQHGAKRKGTVSPCSPTKVSWTGGHYSPPPIRNWLVCCFTDSSWASPPIHLSRIKNFCCHCCWYNSKSGDAAATKDITAALGWGPFCQFHLPSHSAKLLQNKRTTSWCPLILQGQNGCWTKTTSSKKMVLYRSIQISMCWGQLYIKRTTKALGNYAVTVATKHEIHGLHLQAHPRRSRQ